MSFYHTLFEKTPLAAALYTKEGVYFQSNPAFLELIGYTQKECEQCSYWDLTPPHFRTTERKQWHHLHLNTPPIEYEKEFIHKNGYHLYVQIKSLLIKDDRGEELIILFIEDLSNQKHAEKVLSKAQEMLNMGHWHLDLNRIHYDEALRKLLDHSTSSLSLNEFCNLFYKKDATTLSSLFNEAITLGVDFSSEFHIEKNNKLYTFDIHAQTYENENGELIISGSLQDVSQQARQRDEMKINLDMIDKHVIMSKTDPRGIITYASEAFSEISGYRKEELMGRNHNIVRHPDMPDSLYQDLWSTITSKKTWNGKIKNRRKDGSFYWVDTTITPQFDYKGKITEYMAVRIDVTNEKKVEELSITDQLTELYNRRHFQQTFPMEIARAIRNETFLAFAMLDVDFFKPYNDTYGHQAGDDTLKAIADSLTKSIHRKGDTVFRLGGEEFGILCNIHKSHDIEIILEEVRQDIEELKIVHKNNSASNFVTASLGCLCVDLSKAENYNIGTDTMYKLSDDELYKAKENGRNRFSVRYL